MYRVFLVDDEPIFLHHLRSAILWERFDCVLCGEAMDGQEAVEAIRILQPDIVFMDINLPKMNGLEACEAIYTFPNPPHVIVLTAHGEFGFAHKAIKLGVFDYLLKPFDESELIAALNKCITDRQRKESQRVLQQEKEVDDIERYFSSLLELETVEESDWLKIPPNKGFIAAIIQVRGLQYGHLPQIRLDIQDKLDRVLGISSYVIGIYNGRITVVHIIEKDLELEQMRSQYGLILETDASEECPYTSVSLGSVVTRQEEIPLSYQHGVIALENRSRTTYTVITYEDVEELKSSNSSFSIQDVNLLIRLFETGQYDGADKVIEKIFALDKEQMLSFQYLISVYHSLLLHIYSRYPHSEGISRDALYRYKSLIYEFNTCDNTKEIVDILKNNIHEVFSDCINIPVPKKSDILVKKIEQYLLAHYTEESLTVMTIAQALFFESSYIRRVYKTMTQKTIMQRLEEIRMERAKELLEKTQMRSGEIASQVGYADPFYFSKRFKLFTGLPPSDYRNNLPI